MTSQSEKADYETLVWNYIAGCGLCMCVRMTCLIWFTESGVYNSVTILLYCPMQVPMGAHSSSLKKLGEGPYTEEVLE